MPRGITIQDTVILAERHGQIPPTGEARGTVRVPMTPDERHSMVARLDQSIGNLMDIAKTVYEYNRLEDSPENPEYIARLSTPEFFFYTREPLSLNEFEQLQNQIAEKAKNYSPNIQLILGSFAVKTEDNKVMNVVPHITCGENPQFHLIVKNHTSSIDVRYKVPNEQGNVVRLEPLDRSNCSQNNLPLLKIDDKPIPLTFRNIVGCHTPDNNSFRTAVDICLDHYKGVAKDTMDLYEYQYPALKNELVSHVIVSNSVNLNPDKCIEFRPMHVDPLDSTIKCKKGVEQEANPYEENDLSFGKDYTSGNNLYSLMIIEVHPEPLLTLAQNQREQALERAHINQSMANAAAAGPSNNQPTAQNQPQQPPPSYEQAIAAGASAPQSIPNTPDLTERRQQAAQFRDELRAARTAASQTAQPQIELSAVRDTQPQTAREEEQSHTNMTHP